MKSLLSKCATKFNITTILVLKYLRRNATYKDFKLPVQYACSTFISNNITSKFYFSGKDVGSRKNNVAEVHKRYCSSNSGPPSTKLPPLMKFPEVVWPSLIKSFRNFILSTFIIKPYFDKEFNIPDFVQGSKVALEVVSTKIAEGNLKMLNNLVSGEVLSALQSSMSEMSLFQREQISVNVEDIYFAFPYQIGVMFNEEDDEKQKRFVEITMVYHALKGLSAMRARGEEPPMSLGFDPEYQKRISICNYRFIREYTKGKEGEWTINMLNHFRPIDHNN